MFSLKKLHQGVDVNPVISFKCKNTNLASSINAAQHTPPQFGHPFLLCLCHTPQGGHKKGLVN